MAVSVPAAPFFRTSPESAIFACQPGSPRSSWSYSAAALNSEMSQSNRGSKYLVPQSAQSTPQDITAPSPVSSEGTIFSDGDEVDERPSGQDLAPTKEAARDGASPSPMSPLKVETQNAGLLSTNATDDQGPVSVIHAPVGFSSFRKHTPSLSKDVEATSYPESIASEALASQLGSQGSIASDITVTPAAMSEPDSRSGSGSEPTPQPLSVKGGHFYESQLPPTPLKTSLPIAQDWTTTPRAQTRSDLGVFSRPPSALASITESDDSPLYHASKSRLSDDVTESEKTFYRSDDEEIGALHNALSECWTLCNTLANLSYIHRERIFNFSGKGTMQQQAWKSCWKLCQNLYETREEDTPIDVRQTLDLCREFCQALFDVRVRDNETADSVLRVSFELNNHLFNTHDRSLPEAFRERTLDFYITLCHRLMKQKAKMVEETDSLLRACWSLAEMLFSLRQNRREGKKADEDLLGSAIQACWELCDLFRDGWTQIRPDRQTPRASQTTFTQAFQQAKQVDATSNTDHNSNNGSASKFEPETPTTIFEDTAGDSPYEPIAPNIVVYGADKMNTAPISTTNTSSSSGISLPSISANRSRHSGYRWPSTSTASMNSSARTIKTEAEDPTMVLLKNLFIRAALATNRGFAPLASGPSNMSSLPLFARSLPETAFGVQAWQMALLDRYRKAIADDTSFRTLGSAANPLLLSTDTNTHARVREDIARAVKSMISGTYGWSWLKDLFRFAFGVYVEEILDGHNGSGGGSAGDDSGPATSRSRSRGSNKGWRDSGRYSNSEAESANGRRRSSIASASARGASSVNGMSYT